MHNLRDNWFYRTSGRFNMWILASDISRDKREEPDVLCKGDLDRRDSNSTIGHLSWDYYDRAVLETDFAWRSLCASPFFDFAHGRGSISLASVAIARLVCG